MNGLVNAAGIASTKSIEEVTYDEWCRVIDVDLNGVFVCTKAVVPSMASRRKGAIVNVASIAGKRGGGFIGRLTACAGGRSLIGYCGQFERNRRADLQVP